MGVKSLYYVLLVGLVDEVGDITTSEAIKLATAAAGWSQLYQGVPLNKVQLDSVTLTEVLRLHLLSSGGRSGEMSSKWRWVEQSLLQFKFWEIYIAATFEAVLFLF